MLLQFLVENFRSFQKETIFNLAPLKSRIHPDHIIESAKEGRKVRALPLAVFYGANASGKSNLFKAIDFAKNYIVKGKRGDENIDVVPFRLGTEKANSPSRFEFILEHEKVLYTYGFVVTDREVLEEWLFANYENREVLLYERARKGEKTTYKFGPKIAPNKEEMQRFGFISDGTRPNQLFLTEAIERNVELLKPLFKWFKSNLVFIWPEALYLDLVSRTHGEKEFSEYISNFLSNADTGIYGIETKSTPLESNIFDKLPLDEKKEIQNVLNSNPFHSIVLQQKRKAVAIQKDPNDKICMLNILTKHMKKDGSIVSFDTIDESDGTQRMMHITPALYDMQKSERTFFIDELDRSLHPLLCRLFIQKFLEDKKNYFGRGQLIVTTHETNLLDFNLMRRDEIWFVEKDNDYSSRLTSLAEYNVRKDLSIGRGYLNGRFGAIPFLGDFRKLHIK